MSALPTNYLTPTGREEAWRFTPLKRIAGLHDPATSVADRISIALSGAVRPGFTINKVKSADIPAKSATDDAVIQRVRSGVAEVTHLEIGKEAIVAEPIILTRTPGNTSEFSRTVITAGAHSKATVIVENSGNATLGEEIEIRLEAGSNLTFVTLQEWSDTTIHLGRHHAIVGRDATFNSITVTVAVHLFAYSQLWSIRIKVEALNCWDSTLQQMDNISSIGSTSSTEFQMQSLALHTKVFLLATKRVLYGLVMSLSARTQKALILTSSIRTSCSQMARAQTLFLISKSRLEKS